MKDYYEKASKIVELIKSLDEKDTELLVRLLVEADKNKSTDENLLRKRILEIKNS